MSHSALNPENGYAIVGDIHGRVDLLERATQLVDPTDTQFVVQDILDKGPEVRQTLLLARDIGATVLADNHGWVCANAITYSEHGERLWLDGWYRRYEVATLESFGIFRSGNAARDAQHLYQRMAEDGLLALLLNTAPYIEPENDDFIAVHGGLLASVPWVVQRTDLRQASQAGQRWQSAPVQIFDDAHQLSTALTTQAKVTTKRLITGHNHFTATAAERITDHGNRVRLGSRLGKGDPLFIYLTKTKEMLTVEQ